MVERYLKGRTFVVYHYFSTSLTMDIIWVLVLNKPSLYCTLSNYCFGGAISEVWYFQYLLCYYTNSSFIYRLVLVAWPRCGRKAITFCLCQSVFLLQWRHIGLYMYHTLLSGNGLLYHRWAFMCELNVFFSPLYLILLCPGRDHSLMEWEAEYCSIMLIHGYLWQCCLMNIVFHQYSIV